MRLPPTCFTTASAPGTDGNGPRRGSDGPTLLRGGCVRRRLRSPLDPWQILEKIQAGYVHPLRHRHWGAYPGPTGPSPAVVTRRPGCGERSPDFALRKRSQKEGDGGKVGCVTGRGVAVVNRQGRVGRAR